MEPLAALSWGFTALFLLLIIACAAAAGGKIPVNPFFGVRTPSVMSSDVAWRAGHRAAVIPAVVAFVVCLACSLVGLATSLTYLGAIVAFVGGVAWVFVSASRAATQQSIRSRS